MAPAQIPKDFEAAARAFDSANFPEAERLVRAALTRSPDDTYGLNLLAATLDRQEKYKEAEHVYWRALGRGRSATLLNNVGNHYRAIGQRGQARKYYQETVRLEPRHSNANYQLAALDVEDRRHFEALAHLRMLPGAEQQQPAVLLLKGRAQFQSGQPEAARQTLAPLEAALETNSSVAFSLGVAYYQEKLYADAVRAFEAALRQAPGNFDILYNLGLAYEHQGQKGRAAEVLEGALRVNSRSADATYHLAAVMAELGHDEAATDLIIRAREMAPERPELSLLLAHECVKQEFWFDAAEAYESYLRLRPDDWEAQRELAFLYGEVKYFERALPHLDRYIAARPKDAEGYYLRGLILWHLKRSEAASEAFRRALKLNPRLAEAWSRLGEIAREKNDLNEAARNYRKALEIQSNEPNALYGLGQVLNVGGDYREAVPLFEKAIEMRQDEPAPHYQLSLAYRHLGDQPRAQAELEKFQELGQKSSERKYFRTGLVAYLKEGMKLSDSERRARELQYLERAAAIKTGDEGIRARLLDAYLASGKKEKADKTIRQWLGRDPDGRAALKVGEVLARHGDYEGAITYLNQAAERDPRSSAAYMDLADAQFHLGRYNEALKLLAPLTPPRELAVDYHLLEAAILDKLQRFDGALAAYQEAIRAEPRQESPYMELGLFFVAHQAYDAALENFRAAERILPKSLKLALAEAIVLNLAGQREESFTKLRAIEGRWPEQDLPYILAGISAYTTYRFEDSRREFEKAAALGSSNPLTYYYLALLESESAQSNLNEALRWAELAVGGDPTFAQAHFLLGKLHKRMGRIQEARQSLEAAVRLQPNLAEAHYLLSRVYAELGDPARADAETRESVRWHREVHQVSPEKESMLRLFVQVEPARR